MGKWKDFKLGDEVVWHYRHHLNSRSSFVAIKKGVFLGLVKHKPGYSGPQLARVSFDNNKRESRVRASELEPI